VHSRKHQSGAPRIAGPFRSIKLILIVSVNVDVFYSDGIANSVIEMTWVPRVYSGFLMFAQPYIVHMLSPSKLAQT
jgi:hypothetical protein